ncbi:ectonucleotide pyrophosphatase/phosphodiesterase [Clostridium baratii]|uniref:alkaline phosphatase family protein n=1 Tax=Clostridium baratii TaxID=1561 RepID=UPI0029028F9B|nr:ectonucleotide pyrophosphatase/phosphodiesterase [Clostridium baratii]MDU1054087.1 ectonucleotide pyrophosphatase/phosphodiesterase [Clostridium baratii]
MKKKFIILSFDAVSNKDFEYIKNLKNFKELIKDSSYCKNVESVYPSLTYPAHTSISTGKLPINHGIVNNIKVEPFRKKADWFWTQDYINGKTIYDSAKEKGFRTCSLFWPVTAKSKTIDLNLPEVLPNRFWQNQIIVSALNGTLGFQLKINNMFGHLRDGINQPNLDNFTFESLMYVLKNDLADFILVHFTDADTKKHQLGTKNPEINNALNRHDERLGKIVSYLKENNIYDESTIITLGDHGCKDTNFVIKINRLFLEKGYIKVKNEKIKSYDAYCNYCDGSAYIYLNNKNIKDEIYNLLKDFSLKNNNCIKNIYSKEEAVSFGADPNSDFMIEANDGYYFINDYSPNIIEETKGKYDLGTHGYFPKDNDYKTFFTIKRQNIKSNYEISSMTLMDEGATIFHILNDQIYNLDGKVITEIFK